MEIVLVAVILGVIAALAIPAYVRQVPQAQSMEALNQLQAMRQAQMAYRDGSGTFTESLEQLPGVPKLDLALNPRLFDYKVEEANQDKLLIVATSKESVPWSSLPFKVSIDEAGNVQYYWPGSGSAGSPSTGTGGSGGSGSGSGSEGTGGGGGATDPSGNSSGGSGVGGPTGGGGDASARWLGKQRGDLIDAPAG